jgi:hypothetical protein
MNLIPDAAAPSRDQPEFSTSTRVAPGRLLEGRATSKAEPYAAIARLSLAVVNFPGVFTRSRDLGTQLQFHRTRRNRDAPDIGATRKIHRRRTGGPVARPRKCRSIGLGAPIVDLDEFDE